MYFAQQVQISSPRLFSANLFDILYLFGIFVYTPNTYCICTYDAYRYILNNMALHIICIYRYAFSYFTWGLFYKACMYRKSYVLSGHRVLLLQNYRSISNSFFHLVNTHIVLPYSRPVAKDESVNTLLYSHVYYTNRANINVFLCSHYKIMIIFFYHRSMI